MIKLKLKQNSNINKPWVNFYDEGVPKTINYPDKMLWEMIKDSADRNPNLLAYEYYGTTSTFKKLMKDIASCARSLKSIGVREKDIVTICSPNMPQAIILFYAINMVGAISNMVHPLSAEKEIEYFLTVSKSKYIFTVDIACEKVMNVIKNTQVEKVIVMSPAEKMNKITRFAYNLTTKKVKIPYDNDMVFSYNNFIDFGYMYDGKYIYNGKALDKAVILYSGGTTGKPKGIVLSNNSFNAATLQTGSMIGPIEKGDSVLTIMPIFHAFGLDVCIHTPLTFGVKCILVPVFNYKKFGRLIKQYKPNFIVGVPTLLNTMINDKGLEEMDLSFIKCIITGGDTVSPELKRNVDNFMKKHNSKATVRPGYGLTEGAGASCLLPNKVQPEGSIGIPCQDCLYKIVDINTKEDLRPNEIGEICISGPNVMIEYLSDEEETKKVLIKDKKGITWLHTGDVGKMDENGFVYFEQRLKRIIISSGYNIYPSHIESILNKHPLVSEVCVVSMPHPYKTEVAKAFVVLNDQNVNKDKVKSELKKLASEYLAKYSLPYEYEFVSDLPRTNLGKVDYKKLEAKSKSFN